jgi:hypothetical protein
MQTCGLDSWDQNLTSFLYIKDTKRNQSQEKRLNLNFLPSRSRTIKIVVTSLIVVVASISVAISYYGITQLLIQNNSSTPIASPTPTVSPTPTATFSMTPTPAPTPTPTSSPNPTPTPTPELGTQEKILNSIMYHIEVNHPETSQFMKNLVWTGGRVAPQNIVGAETYMYYSQGWNVTINYPVIPNAIYNIVADYSTTSIGIPYRIIWQGTWQNEVINEKSYVFAQ